MQVEKDFIKREIQRLNLLLTSLIEKIRGLNLNDTNNEISSVSETLESEFDLSLSKIMKMENADLLKHIKSFHESHTEKLVELMYEIVLKSDSAHKNERQIKLTQKALLLIDFLDEQSNIFSVNRMNMAENLKNIQ